MPKVYVLDNVIKRISENEASQIEKQIEKSDAKKLMIIDEKTQTVLMKKPLFALGRQLAFFLVYNENDPQNFAKSHIKYFSVGDDFTAEPIGIMVRYRVSCPPGNENVDLIVSLLAILLVMLVITAGAYQDINTHVTNFKM